MAKIAIMGFGTVGSGVLEVCRRNAASIARRAGEPVEVKYILDVRDFSDSLDAALFVKDINVILNDPEVKVVVETIGGTRFAYPYVRQCLESGRSVCTSNKEMVATYGAELLALAREHKAAFLFEASVGGGTPIITPMHQCLAANQISQIQGIVNGTTNFMLTKMKRENMGFDAALKIAQQLGYAETKDPGDDVDGRDACRKIAILSSLACGHHVYPDNIPARGIRDVTVEDVLQYPTRVFSVGRLDKDSEGLLLVTNNGDIINQIMRAGNYHEKEYLVTVDKPVTEEFVEQMSRGGIPVLDARTRPCKVEKIGKYRFRIILTQGLNRQIRRMCEYCGCRVKKLVRVRVMNIELGNLPKGQYRDVTEAEMQELYRQLRAGNKKAGKSRRGTWTKNARE